MSMQFPSRDVMETLFAIVTGREMFSDAANRLFVELDTFVLFEIQPEAIDALEARGWIDLSQGEDEVHVTEAGKHWCRRYWQRKGAIA